jgi:hypothetical protein
MKQKINSLDDLSRYILDDKVPKELKLKVFIESLKAYPVIVMPIFSDHSSNLIHDPDNALIPNMQRVLNEIKADGSKEFYSGFMVLLK